MSTVEIKIIIFVEVDVRKAFLKKWGKENQEQIVHTDISKKTCKNEMQLGFVTVKRNFE